MSSVVRKLISFFLAPESPPFEFTPLPTTRSFRVFHLLPQNPQDKPSNDLSGVLRGRIDVLNLDHGCRYNALSYCWEGSIEPSPYTHQNKDRILIDDTDGRTTQLPISPALSTALRYLRAQPGQALPLFIDQICINQNDNTEKSHQINLMGDIYRSCKCVVAWLDVGTRYTDALFDFLPQISENELLLQLSQNPQRTSPVLKAAMDRRTDFSDDEAAVRQDFEKMVALTRDHWLRFPHRGFLDICLRRWFRRIWIVQEACLGHDMVFVCGSRMCPSDALHAAAQFELLASTFAKLEAARPSPTEQYKQAKWDKKAMRNSYHGSALVDRIFRDRSAALRPSADGGHAAVMRRGLDNLVIRFNVDTMVQGPYSRLGSSNPSDCIYALKGLVREGDPVSDRLAVDYDLSPAAVFTDFTRLLYQTATPSPPIDTLFLSQADTKVITDLPSWVPDWSSHIAIPHGYRRGCYPEFNAGGTKLGTPEMDFVGPNILKIQAVPLSEITDVGTHYMQFSTRKLADAMASPGIVARTIFNFFREVRELCKLASTKPGSASIPSPTHSKVDEAAWVTSTGGHGLKQTLEKSLLGNKTVDGKPFLGYLWEFQLKMEALPTIFERRREGLEGISQIWAAASLSAKTVTTTKGPSFITSPRLRAAFVYCISRLWIELRHIFWLWKYLCCLPGLFLVVGIEAEDMMYGAVFGVVRDDIPIGWLKSILEQHVRRKCFVSAAGHVGLGPVGTLEGDVVVVPIGASMPAILRRGKTAKDTWKYVGEAYVHGFMNGEAFTGKEKLETRWFEID
ncbi:heterokaryon incompatibility protein-domain-containing protein [Podospora didyma]|uniref:Heterokaryon incompatibility protein-domain-containing protein n=1 Tax=Podospora didyma TaxID=330526 RepID=A0AAE0K325_9PEZI|nr:heterokaryon incompatibility protein-domain-containing protein [Podospora didyma]